MEVTFFIKIIISAILGGLIGLERDISHKDKEEQFAGLRTYAIIAISGALGIFLDSHFKTNYIFTGALFLAISILVICSYIYSSFRKKEIGITSEICAILAFFIGVLIGADFTKIATIFTIILVSIIALKDRLGTFKSSISKDEFMYSLKFGVVAFVVLPLLPDMKFSINDLFSLFMNTTNLSLPVLEMKFFNPYSVWFFVVVISAVGYVGYILSKLLGKNSSVILSSVIGGLVSSTAVTATMSEQSKKDSRNPFIYALGTLAANSVMLIRVICIVLVLNFSLLGTLYLPALLMLAGFVIVMIYSYIQAKAKLKKTSVDIEKGMESPFNLGPALKFGLFIIFIKFIAGLGLLYKDVFLGDYFYYIFGVISGFADVDAITQAISTQSAEGLLAPKIAITTILIAVMSNNIVKATLAYKFGDSKFSKIVSSAFVLSIILGIVGILVV